MLAESSSAGEHRPVWLTEAHRILVPTQRSAAAPALIGEAEPFRLVLDRREPQRDDLVLGLLSLVELAPKFLHPLFELCDLFLAAFNIPRELLLKEGVE